MKRLALLAVATLGALAGGCSVAPQVGETLTLQGTLVIKGNEPRTVAVLVRTSSEQWELQDVEPATFAALQNRKVEATGRVSRAPGGALLPALRVNALRRNDGN